MKTHLLIAIGSAAVFTAAAHAQSVDRTLAPNTAKAGIAKSLEQQIGAGRGDALTPDSAVFVIKRDPFRAVRRGRQLFQRKFTSAQGQGPNEGDGSGDINTDIGIGAGLSDSCALCHGRPRGSAGTGGNVATRPDSRDAPHLFGLGLKEMLADEMTEDLRGARDRAIDRARDSGHPVTMTLESKGIQFGSITASPNGAIDASRVEGVDADLRIKPFFAEGSTISMREFIVGAMHNEMGIEIDDPLLAAASAGAKVVTPAGMVLDGSMDRISAPPAPDRQSGRYEVDPAVVDHLEFYLLNYFKPAVLTQDASTGHGLKVFEKIECGACHHRDLLIEHDRRVADVETERDPAKGIFNTLFATARPLIKTMDDGSGFPTLKLPELKLFLVKNIFTDFKRHDVGAGFYERNYDGTLRKQFLTRPLWGVASTGPYGHDGRSNSLDDVILRHGGEAKASRDAYAALPEADSADLLKFLGTLVLFPPDDTASNLDPGDPGAPQFPQFGHGSIKLTVLFNDPAEVE